MADDWLAVGRKRQYVCGDDKDMEEECEHVFMKPGGDRWEVTGRSE